ncbi:type II toxin-antitoxin system VapC family toxin [Sphingomonas sp. CGMCC 1.13654]|uniref:Ribonuclease VapC n=1 Tax=Sphingomonas chungangi TaxID=2683589 RepID=A0A838LAK8_9SPHN|nr:type II toxin-antitoxin system VapC family toxin [Sphingomonas chungangi]MBA2936291.1 type II toxin-antitoxin system VapC family toxin [Sphingomonas chungangi]MVW55676.1 PIN domain-containing protein [Sphingomonas chungangi]
MLVVDASVAVKWVVPEDGEAGGGTDAALALLERGLLAPDFLLAEFGNVLWKKVRRGETAVQQASDALRILPTIVSLVPAASYMDKAFEIAVALDHPVYDCIYLAVAQVHDVALATADRRLAERCRSSKFSVSIVDLAS